MVTRTHLVELGIELLTVPVAGYLFNRSYPAPNLTHMVVITVVDAFVRKLLSAISNIIAMKLSERSGYIVVNDHRKEIINNKFYQLTNCGSLAVLCLLPIFYRVAGQKVGLQIPHYLMTSTYLLVAMRATSFTLSASRFVRASFQRPEQKLA